MNPLGIAVVLLRAPLFAVYIIAITVFLVVSYLLRKLGESSMRLLIFLLLISGAACAQDEFYSIGPGDAAAQIGAITATGFIETSGFGVSDASREIPGSFYIVGFDIVMTAPGIGSAILCDNESTCVGNDIAIGQANLLATSAGLYCAAGCVFQDAGAYNPSSGSAFAFSSTTGWIGENYYQVNIGGLSSPVAEYTNSIPGVFAIAGGSPTKQQPILAPELNWNFEAIVFAIAFVLLFRKRSA
jgi:hypothetical protein